MYTSYSLKKHLDMDKAAQAPNQDCPEAASTVFCTYADAAHKQVVFYGEGIAEFREITREQVRKGSNSTYKFQLFDGEAASPAVSVTTDDGTDGARDMYIFYTVYNLDTSK